MSGRIVAGKYQMVRKLGSGGMGHVYLATHLQMKRDCAIKLIQPVLEWDPDSVARFHREAENASKVNHPNVAQIYDFGEDDGKTYLAMEYVDGEPLSAVLKLEGALSPRRTARIIWQTANALSAAHELRIVHRDLKPENIMLTRFRQWNDFVKVVDFGIARIVGLDQQVTLTGAFIGTPEYMAPEQFVTGLPDPKGDLYALGLIAVKCLTGKLPPVVGAKVVVQPKDPANPAGLGDMEAARKWPEPVRACLCKALAWDANERFASPETFAQAFARVVSKWEPPAAGVREPWEGRLDEGFSAATVNGSAPDEAAAKVRNDASEPPAGPHHGAEARGRGLAKARRMAPAIAATGALLLLVGVGIRSYFARQYAIGADTLSLGNFPSGLVPPPLTPTGAPATKPVDTQKDPGPGARPRTEPARVATVVLADSVLRLEQLSDPSTMTAASAEEAVRLYQGIRERLQTVRNQVSAAFFAARALAFLDRDGEACGILRSHEGAAEAMAEYREAYQSSLALCPK